MKFKLGKIITILFFVIVLVSLIVPRLHKKEIEFVGIDNDKFSISAEPKVYEVAEDAFIEYEEVASEVVSSGNSSYEYIEDSVADEPTTEVSTFEITTDIAQSILKYDMSGLDGHIDIGLWTQYLAEKTNTPTELSIKSIGVSEDGLTYAVIYEIISPNKESGLLKVTLDSSGIITGIRKYIN